MKTKPTYNIKYSVSWIMRKTPLKNHNVTVRVGIITTAATIKQSCQRCGEIVAFVQQHLVENKCSYYGDMHMDHHGDKQIIPICPLTSFLSRIYLSWLYYSIIALLLPWIKSRKPTKTCNWDLFASSFKSLNIFIVSVFKSLLSESAILYFSKAAVVWSGRGILSCLLLCFCASV